MGYLRRLGKKDALEDLRSLELAAERRFYDALELATAPAGCESSAIYLFGYAAEIILKVACFNLDGASLGTRTDRHRKSLANLPTYKSSCGSNHHCLVGWLEVLLELRRKRGLPTTAQYRRELRRRVKTLSGEWSESIRYRSLPATRVELSRVYNTLSWLMTERFDLYK